jgi:hypothetical protein
MKHTLVIIGLFSSFVAFAQNDDRLKLLDKNFKKQPVTLKTKTILPSTPYMTLSNGNRVYALPQDNMPCIVPKMAGNMPNAGNQQDLQNSPNSIPNPAPPLKLFDNTEPLPQKEKIKDEKKPLN